MGKAARNRRLRQLAVDVTFGYPELTKTANRQLKKQARELRRRGVSWRGDVRVVD